MCNTSLPGVCMRVFVRVPTRACVCVCACVVCVYLSVRECVHVYLRCMQHECVYVLAHVLVYLQCFMFRTLILQYVIAT